jgi:hypothetical protein
VAPGPGRRLGFAVRRIGPGPDGSGTGRLVTAVTRIRVRHVTLRPVQCNLKPEARVRVSESLAFRVRASSSVTPPYHDPCHSLAYPCHSLAYPCHSLAYPCHSLQVPDSSAAAPADAAAMRRSHRSRRPALRGAIDLGSVCSVSLCQPEVAAAGAGWQRVLRAFSCKSSLGTMIYRKHNTSGFVFKADPAPSLIESVPILDRNGLEESVFSNFVHSSHFHKAAVYYESMALYGIKQV